MPDGVTPGLPLVFALCGALLGVAFAFDAVRRRDARLPALLPRATAPLPDTVTPLLFALIAWFGGNLAVALLLRPANGAPTPTLVTFVLGSALHLALAVALFLFARHAPQYEGGRAPARFRLLAIGAGTGLAAFAVVYVVGQAIVGAYAAAGREPPQQETVQFMSDAQGWELVLASVLAVVVAPFAEEVFFRGILFPALAREMPVAAALVLQALLFGAVHVSQLSHLVFMAPLTLVGLATGWIYLRTRSLSAAVMAHAVFNAVELGLFLADR